VPRFTSGPDLWARLRTARPAVLETVFKKYAKEWNGRSRPSSRKA
jgi:hypothetical protein